MASCFLHRLAIISSSSLLKTFPIGLCGVLMMIILVLALNFDSNSFGSRTQSALEMLSPVFFGRNGMYTGTPPAI
uniref:Uncharacterized protein n=1 Tax=Ixodes ricinus TaxID=34613 RepID=A0A6B0U4S0_IXORI